VRSPRGPEIQQKRAPAEILQRDHSAVQQRHAELRSRLACRLGHSPTAKFYAIKSPEEARQYLEHPVLGPRLRACAEEVLSVERRSASEIFGFPDDVKLRSSMTLFASLAEPGSIFVRVLDKYFHGEPDQKTLELLKKLGK